MSDAREISLQLQYLGYSPLAAALAAKYKDKKVEESGNITYVYDEEHIKERTKQKVAQVAKLNKSISALQDKVYADLGADDPQTQLTALAVALINSTYERVGNDASAKEGHVGVTGWKIKNMTVQRNKATFRYVGKSGVEQEKVITNPKIVRALKNIASGRANGYILYDPPTKFRVRASDVNRYLKGFDITAKDLRGFHANREMLRHLKQARKGNLPEVDTERASMLKTEFKEALDKVAAIVGHEASTLKSQYLVPSIEESYMSDGTIISNFV
jgi:DNA topoisomerase-1